MSLINVTSVLTPRTISQSETDSVDFLVAGTLNIAGTSQMPIAVTLSQVASVALAGTINISNANVLLGGVAGVSGLVHYNIGTGGTLDVLTALDVALSSTVAFTGTTGSLVLASGINPNLFGAIAGFGPGKSIDYATNVVSRVSYADATGPNTGGTLSLYGTNNNVLSTIVLRDGDFATNNFRLHTDGAAGTIIDFRAYVTGITASPANALLGVGQTATFIVTTSNPVTVTGLPKLVLDDGGVATYDPAHSTSTQLAFTYTVARGDTTPDLAVTAIDLTGATLAAVGGGTVDLSGAIANPAGTLAIDGISPVASRPTLSVPDGYVTVGRAITITIALSKPVTVANGSPTLNLNDGGIATYDAAKSTPISLVFDYVVQSGQNTPDLAISAANANGSIITDAAGNPLDVATLVGAPAGALVVDTIAPTPTSIFFSTTNTTLGIGDSVDLILTSSEPVQLIGGMPSILLSDGGSAYFDASRSTPTRLVQHYVVQAGDNSDNLSLTGFNLNGGVLSDLAGNVLNTAGAIPQPAGILKIDTTPPTVTGVTTTPGSGTLRAGQTVSFVVAVTEPVIQTGSLPTLKLSDGGIATFDAAHSTPTSLVFTHTVQPGQNATDLAITGFTTAGNPITDVAHNVLDLTAAITNPSGTLSVDTTAPVATAVTLSNGAGNTDTAGTGATIALTVALSEPVLITGGALTLTLNDGATATFDAVSSTPTSLVFRYVVQPGDMTPGLAISSVNPNGATLLDLAGNPLNLASLLATPANTLRIDTLNPLVTSVSTDIGSGTLRAGQTVAITLTLSQAVDASGSIPTLMLNDGGTATFDAARSTPTALVFTHTVQPGQNATDLAITGIGNTGTALTNAAGKILDLTAAIANPAGILAVDTAAPVATAIALSNGTGNTGTAGTGATIALTVALSEPVLITGGAPTLTLNDGATATLDTARSTPTSLVFRYVVQPGDMTPGLAVSSVNPNGATLLDLAGNPLNLASLLATPANTLRIDTLNPLVTSVSTDIGSGTLRAGQTVAITLTLSQAVDTSGSLPALMLSDGSTAIFDAAHSTPTSLVFTHTVQPGQTTADLAVTGVTNTGNALTTAAGNVLDLTAAIANPVGILAVDTTAPTISTLTLSPGTGSISAGQLITFSFATSEPLLLSGGTPTLALNDGGIAVFDAAASSATRLVFDDIVQPGQNVAALAITGADLHGAALTDLAGNPLDAASLVRALPTALRIDTTPPLVTSVTTDPVSGQLAAGQTVAITVTLDKPVTIGTVPPNLTLSDGGTAIYDAVHSTPTMLVFTHTIRDGQNTADLAVTGISGASLLDAAGNALDLARAIGNPAGTLAVDTMPPSPPTPAGAPAAVQILDVALTPGTGSLTPGTALRVVITTDNPVTIAGGIPTLALSDGGVATYDPALSTPTQLVFVSVVQPGQHATRLSIAGFDLGGAAIADANGQMLSLITAQVPSSAQLSVIDAPFNTPIPTTPSNPSIPNPSIPNPSIPNPSIPDPSIPNPAGTLPSPPAPATPDPVVTSPANPPAALADPTGMAAPPSSSGTAAIAPPSLPAEPTSLPVYRFFNQATGSHFYTSDAAERDSILQNRPDLVAEGPGGVGLRAANPATDAAATPVFRFFDTIHGTEFLTASTTERDTLVASRPDLNYEPSGTFYEHARPQAGDTPVFRFFDTHDGTHFYTDSPTERATIIQTRPDLTDEGIGFYEPK